jgi:SAM-dependent methyltransferase
MTTALTDDYVLGTHDAELARLGLQHRVWRARALDGWQRAGFGAGQTLLDVGSGPGYATRDLAEIAGAHGRVLAFDKSARFLDALRGTAVRHGLSNIIAKQIDLDADPLPVENADGARGAHGAWVRWVFAFMADPRDLVARIGAALRPGGAIVIHEYFDYRSWSFAERSETFAGFVDTVMRSWRASGGEPDVGRALPEWLEQSGFRVASVRPYIDVITPSDFMWQWPKAFVNIGVERLVEIGALTAERAAAIVADFTAREAKPHVRMVTPAVLEIVAVRE